MYDHVANCATEIGIVWWQSKPKGFWLRKLILKDLYLMPLPWSVHRENFHLHVQKRGLPRQENSNYVCLKLTVTHSSLVSTAQGTGGLVHRYSFVLFCISKGM